MPTHRTKITETKQYDAIFLKILFLDTRWL